MRRFFAEFETSMILGEEEKGERGGGRGEMREGRGGGLQQEKIGEVEKKVWPHLKTN